MMRKLFHKNATVVSKKEKYEVAKYLKLLAEHSLTPQHELILDCLERYDVYGTRELRLWQVKEFWEEYLKAN